MKKSILWVVLPLMTFAMMQTSCVSVRNVRYLQDMDHNSRVPLNDKFEAEICPYDELTIMVRSNDGNEEAVRPFNMGDLQDVTRKQNMGYLVDVNGNIVFPMLGEIHAAGLTRLQLQDTIKMRLEKNRYLGDPLVDVRFKNFKIYFLSGEGGKVINVTNERCTFLEALALSGGMDIYTKRSKIGVMREVNGNMVMRYLDPRSSEVFNDPFFLLQQNDIIFTQKFKSVYHRDNWNTVLTTITSVTSLFTTYLLLDNYFGWSRKNNSNTGAN